MEIAVAIIGGFAAGFFAGGIFAALRLSSLYYNVQRDVVRAGMFTFENGVYSVRRVE